MGKRTGEQRIVIASTDDAPEPNGTLLALLRDGEKIKPGDARGTLADRLGAEVLAYQAEQVRVAKHRRGAVKGTITITISTVTGPSGDHQYAVDLKAKPARIPAGMSMVFVDDDGELTGRPVEPLTEEMYRRERAAGEAKTDAGPKVGAASNM